MSGGPKPTFLMPAYDAQELRRRMAVCFTIGELYKLAEKLGVPATPSWSNSPQDASRDIVRHFERSGALPFLVEALQEAKPLVEWPEPLPPPAPMIAAAPHAPASPAGNTSFGAPVSAAFADAVPAEQHGDRPTPIASIPAEAVLASARRHTDPPQAGSTPPPALPPMGFAPAIMPRPDEAPPALPPPSAASPGPLSAPSTSRKDVDGDLAAFAAAGAPSSKAAGPGRAPVWPGTTGAASTEPKAPPDLRIVLGASAAFVIVAIGAAFFVGRASSAAPSGSGTTTGSKLPDGHVAISHHVIDALGASLERVAHDCQIDLSTLRGRPLFEVAYRRCGPLPAQPASQPAGTGDTDPLVVAQPGDNPRDPPKKGRTTGGNKLQKVDTGGGGGATPGGTCLSRCSQSHNACISRCGAEPKQGSQYDAYQSCLSGCLKALSQCKMGCQ